MKETEHKGKTQIAVQSNEVCVLDDELTLDSLQTQEFRSSYVNLIKAQKAIAKLKRQVDTKIGKLMEPEYLETGNNKIETEEFKITYIAGFVRTSLNSKALKEEQPEVYDKYTRSTVTSSSIRCTLNKKKPEEE